MTRTEGDGPARGEGARLGTCGPSALIVQATFRGESNGPCSGGPSGRHWIRRPSTTEWYSWTQLDALSRVLEDRNVPFQVEFRNVAGEAAAIGSAGPYTLVVDRPLGDGGRGLGFNGGQLLYIAIGGCVSNDLFREAAIRNIDLTTSVWSCAEISA
jgi:hypothetical protein